MVAVMTVWYLIMWSAVVSPFEAGQYQTQERCENAAIAQTVGLRHLVQGKLHWRCELRWEKN
jgi:hypothetical protein